MEAGFFRLGGRGVVTGDRYLWDYLDQLSGEKHDFDYSGFALIDYFLTFVALPEPLKTLLGLATSPDGHYYCFDYPLAADVSSYLETHPPDPTELSGFASEQGQVPGDYARLLMASHDALIRWLKCVSPSHCGVLHLTF